MIYTNYDGPQIYIPSFVEIGQPVPEKTPTKGYLHIKNVNLNFLRKRQTVYGTFIGRGNLSLYKWPRSNGQDSRHAHIW